MKWINLKITRPQLGAPLLRIQLVVNPALAGGSLAGALLNLAALAVLDGTRLLLARATRHARVRACHG